MSASVGTYHRLHYIPLLSRPLGQGLPYLLAHAHVLLGHPLELPLVPVIGALALHQPLVALAAGVRRLVGEVATLDLAQLSPCWRAWRRFWSSWGVQAPDEAR